MPTPVAAAKQCLTTEAACALDEAVGVARRRSHAKTTSLHAVSAFLAQPSSSLREACTRARSSAYSPRLQFKALELYFGVALDRLPSSQAVEEPPISNSLMAAIRRSLANQRRQPESFQFHMQQQQQQQQQSSLSCIKVELRQLTLSILDDPVVSRVFAEAGFRSCDIKLAIVRPPPMPLIRYPRRFPPVFLCNLTGGDSEPGRRSFSFPFSGFAGFSGPSGVDDNCMRIGEILAKKSGKNLLVVGVFAHDTVRSFAECVRRGKAGVLPAELSGLNFICIEKELYEFFSGIGSEDSLALRFEELARSVEGCTGSGVVVNIGDLKVFIAEDSIDAVNYVVTQLTKLLKLHHGHLWLIMEAANYEIYLKLLRRFPSIEKDWDLQLLPITTLKTSTSSTGGPYFRTNSLMESFVPFGGFLPMTPHPKGPLSSTSQLVSRCHLCNEKYEQELSSILKGGCIVSVEDQRQSNLPAWLHEAELSINEGLETVKAKDDGLMLNSRVLGLQRKWNDRCLHLHQSCRKADVSTCQAGSQSFPTFEGFPSFADGKEKLDSQNASSKNASIKECGCKDVFPPSSMNLERSSMPQLNVPISVVPKSKSEDFLSTLQVTPSKSEHLEAEGVFSPKGIPSIFNMPDDHASPSPATLVMTDLGLGSLYTCTSKDPKQSACLSLKGHLQDCSGLSPTEIDVINSTISNPSSQSPSHPGPDLREELDPRYFKDVWRGLMNKVGRQDEALYAISQTIAHCRTEAGRRHGSNQRGDIWLNILGPDRVAKKRTALALADIIFGSKDNLIWIDPGSHCSSRRNMILDHPEMTNYDVTFRGTTVVDYIAGELRKKPFSVIFIENVEKVDLLVQGSLSSAIRTGKFSDSHGREILVNDVIFVTTSRATKCMKSIFSGKESVKFSEERILQAQCRQMKIFIGDARDNSSQSNTSNVLINHRKGSSSLFVKKRKLIGSGDPTEQCETPEAAKQVHKPSTMKLDLNLPVEELEANDTDNRTYDSDAVSENSEAWLGEFFDQMDKTVIFKPFDFDALAEKILKAINKSFCQIIGCNGLLEIDEEVMEQILAAAWSSDRYEAVEDWVNYVLGRCFAEARQTYSFLVRSVLKLVSCEGILMEEQAPGIRLPAQIILN